MERNIFKAAAMAMWAQGLDGEEIAKELAKALRDVIREGKGESCNLASEFMRLIAGD